MPNGWPRYQPMRWIRTDERVTIDHLQRVQIGWNRVNALALSPRLLGESSLF
jgi:hypothetical protein